MCLRITRVHVETDGWTQRKTARGVKQRGTETKDRRRVKCCCVVSWQLCAGQLGSGGPGSVDLTHLGEWRENSAITDFLA